MPKKRKKEEVAGLAANTLHPKEIPETSSIRGIKYLSCQGGGMKGIGYVGAIRELDNLGVLPQLEEVAGSSAGGFLAVMLAIGCTADELEAEMLSMNFRTFQDKRDMGWVEASKIKQLLKGGADIAESVSVLGKIVKHVPLVGEAARELTPGSLLHKALRGAEKGVGAAEKGEEIAGVALGSELGLWEGDALTYYLANLVARKTGNPNITFRELATLCEANGSPFKKLTLTGSDISNGKLEYYNAVNTPDMPIIQAARISASFPGAYKPVVLEDGGIRVDGGLLENLPDVFNNPPYLTPDSDNGSGGNRYAFALSFTSKESEKPKDIHSLVGLGAAMYSAKNSERRWKAKYGRNIAAIDTVGMGTLDFDASEQQKQKLITSGQNSVRHAFSKILNSEDEIEYDLVPVDELIRIKVALTEKNKDETVRKEREKNERVLTQLSRELNYRVENYRNSRDYGTITKRLIERLEDSEKKKYLKKKKIDEAALSDQQLSEICSAKKSALNKVTKQLSEKLSQLELSKAALEFNVGVVLQKFKGSNYKNNFSRELHELKRLEDVINDNLLEQQAEKRGSERQLDLEDAYLELKAEKKSYYQMLLKKYGESNSKNAVLEGLFRDLWRDSGKSKFKIPTTVKQLRKYCLKDVDTCEAYIDEVKEALETKTSELNLFIQYKKKFTERTDKALHYAPLIRLSQELDKTINRRTTLLTKVNHYLLKKAPKLERVILGFSKAVSVLSFACWSPVGLPALGISKAVNYFSSKPKVKEIAENIIDFFSWTDVGAEHCLQKLRDETQKFVKKMGRNYAESDSSEIRYLHKLHELYFKKSGVEIENIFVRNPGESLALYNERVKKEAAALNADNKSENASEGVARNFEQFEELMSADIKQRREYEAEMPEEEPNPLAAKAREEVKHLGALEREALVEKFRKERKKHSERKNDKVPTSAKVDATIKAQGAKKGGKK